MPGFMPLSRAARSLSRAPGFTLVAAGTLALGIGATTGMFTVFEQVVLRPLPVDEQDELVVVWTDHRARDFPHFPFLQPAYELLEREAASFASVAAVTAWGSQDIVVLSGDGETRRLRWSPVAGDFFGTLGVQPVAGRTLGPADDVPGAERVAVISQGLWERRYGSDPAALGSLLRTDGGRHRIVGVVPGAFDYPRDTEVWAPQRTYFSPLAAGTPIFEVELVARLAPGATSASAAAEIERLIAARPDLVPIYGEAEAVVRPYAEVVLGDLRAVLILLFAGTVLVLLVASLNVANLVLVRAGGREEALAVRRALGAGRGRLACEALAEGAVVGGLGGIGGVAVAVAAVRLILPLAPAGLPRVEGVTPPDVPALLLLGGVTVAVVLFLGLLPALRAERRDAASVLRGGGRATTGKRRSRGRALVVAQTALAVWATAAGALLARTLANLRGLDLGFAAEGLTLVELQVPYPFSGAPPDLADRFRRVSERLAALPGIEGATPAYNAPLTGTGGISFPARAEGQSLEDALERNLFVNVELVQPGYFELLELPIVAGRAIRDSDGAGDVKVVVVNERAAAALWPGEDAVGQRIIGAPGYRDVPWTVIGVAADARYQALVETRPIAYFPLAQLTTFAPSHLLVRTSAPDVPVLAAARAAWRDVDPRIRAMAASSLVARLREPLARPRFAALILGVLAAATLVLAGVGVYGVMAAQVRARTGEMGVRLALGAHPGSVRGLVIGQAMRQAALGAAVGAAAVLLSGALLESLLFQVSPADPWSLCAGALLVLAATAAACALPAIRAGRMDPVRALRAE